MDRQDVAQRILCFIGCTISTQKVSRFDMSVPTALPLFDAVAAVLELHAVSFDGGGASVIE